MITITYNAVDADDTRKTFEVIRALKQNDIDETPAVGLQYGWTKIADL